MCMCVSYHIGHIVDPRVFPVRGISVGNQAIFFSQTSASTRILSLPVSGWASSFGAAIHKQNAFTFPDNKLKTRCRWYKWDLLSWPFAWLSARWRCVFFRIQDPMYLFLSLLIHSLLFGAVAELCHDVFHGGELVVALSLGTQADLIAMVFNLGFMPQGHLDLCQKGLRMFSYRWHFCWIFCFSRKHVTLLKLSLWYMNY